MKKILLFLTILLGVSNFVSSQFFINSRPVIYNQTDSIYMCVIPDSIFGKDYSAVITPDTIFQESVDSILVDTIYGIDTLVWQTLQINNDSIYKCEDSIVFKNILGNKKYLLRSYLSNDSIIDYNIVFTNIPIVVLEGDFGYDYTYGNVNLYLPDSTISMENMNAKIKWRGGSTNTANKHKRNYTIKFINENQKKQKRQLFGLRKHNQWILNAGQVDLGRCRNQIGHELWHDIAHPPYYIDKEPEALTSVRGKFVEVILNEEYRGLYSMSENVDEDQMRLKEYDEENGVIHGQLWKTDTWDGTAMYDLKQYDNTQERYRGFETKYPDFDDVNPTDYSTLYNAIRFSIYSSDEEFMEQVSDYFDIPVLIDYYIFMNVLVALDNNGKNMFWACYDKQESPKLTIAVWDLDCTVGQNYTDTDPHPDAFGPEVDMRTMNVIKVIDRMRKTSLYADSIFNRYWNLRQTHLHTDSLIARYENYFNLFHRGGVVYREEQRWSGDTDIAGLILDFEEELEFIRDWIQKRFDFLDNNEFFKDSITTTLESFIYQTDTNQMYNILGVPVSNPKSGLYIQKGKIILIH